MGWLRGSAETSSSSCWPNIAETEQARREAVLIQRCFAPEFILGENKVFVSASLGVSTSRASETGTEAETLIRDADTAMYQAKEAGRDTVAVFDASIREQIADRLALEHDLRLAIEREEFRLVYQPIITLSESGRSVIGLEALLRWEGPTQGARAARYVHLHCRGQWPHRGDRRLGHQRGLQSALTVATAPRSRAHLHFGQRVGAPAEEGITVAQDTHCAGTDRPRTSTRSASS